VRAPSPWQALSVALAALYIRDGWECSGLCPPNVAQPLASRCLIDRSAPRPIEKVQARKYARLDRGLVDPTGAPIRHAIAPRAAPPPPVGATAPTVPLRGKAPAEAEEAPAREGTPFLAEELVLVPPPPLPPPKSAPLPAPTRKHRLRMDPTAYHDIVG
jgi:hypothetical protein